MADNIFAQLDQELESIKEEVVEDERRYSGKKGELVKSLLSTFWEIWVRFEKNKRHFTMNPQPSEFAAFPENGYPSKWTLKTGVNYADPRFDEISLVDKTAEQARIGDTLKARFYTKDGESCMRITFEYCEGEHYYKYAGWKRLCAQHIIFDGPIDKISPHKPADAILGLVKAWFESHLRRNRDLILKYVRDNYEKAATVTV